MDIGRLLTFLKENKMTVTTAESCTGGMIAAAITDVPGASGVFKGGFVTYSDQAKHDLIGVSEKILREFTAVSEETAREMAIGAALRMKAQCAISVTGIAGPSGGDETHPVGTVYTGIFVNGEVRVFHNVYQGSRALVRTHAMEGAFTYLKKEVEKALL